MSTNKNNLTISGNIEVTPALKKNIQEMVVQLQNKFDSITKTHVILKIDNVPPISHIAEARISLSNKKEIFAEASNENMYTSLSQLKDKLTSQILKHKEKIKNHREIHPDNHKHHNQDNISNL